MRLALYQPDQAGNVGTILRLAACFRVPVDIIEPCGFPFSDRALKRAGMDYVEMAAVTRHSGWEPFESSLPGRLVLFTTAGALPLPEARFGLGDTLMFGSESRGAPRRCMSGPTSGCGSRRRRGHAPSTSPSRPGSGSPRRFGRRGCGPRRKVRRDAARLFSFYVVPLRLRAFSRKKSRAVLE